jgi:ketosteroid isomerase-like protein
MTPEEVALAFVEAINSARAGNVAEWMTPDHTFIDSDGTRTSGREKMRESWERYFKMVPDYRIEVTEKSTRGGMVNLVGKATGTFQHEGILKRENSWSVPAAWRAVVDGEKVAEWQVFVNTRPMLEIMKRLGMI